MDSLTNALMSKKLLDGTEVLNDGGKISIHSSKRENIVLNNNSGGVGIYLYYQCLLLFFF